MIWTGTLLLLPILWWAIEKLQHKTHPVSEVYQTDLVFPHEEEFELYRKDR